MARVAPEKTDFLTRPATSLFSQALQEKIMPKIFTDGKKKQMVYIYRNALADCISVEVSHPVLKDIYTHCNLSADEFEQFVIDCQVLLNDIKSPKNPFSAGSI
jgi:hypothetical protein